MGANDSVGIYCYNDARSDYERARNQIDLQFRMLQLCRSLGYAEDSGAVLECKVKIDRGIKAKSEAAARMHELVNTYRSALLEHEKYKDSGQWGDPYIWYTSDPE